MAWKYDVEDIIPPKLITFSPVKMVILFTLLLALVMFLLYPKAQVLKKMANSSEVSPISVIYLNGLIQREPDNFYYRFLLVSQDIALGYWRDAASQLYFLEKNTDKANSNFQTHILWLNFELNLNLAYQKKVGTLDRVEAENKAYTYLTQLIPIEMSQPSLDTLATAALGLNHPESAILIYQKILNLYPIQSKSMLVQIAHTALMSGSYQLSGDLYFKVAHMAKTLPETRKYILLGLQAYQADQLYTVGFNQLAAFQNPYLIDSHMAMVLTKFALAANRPDMAEKYVKQVLASQGENEQSSTSSTKQGKLSPINNQGEI
ncbi:MAG: hypothetical protein HKM04_04445 [Legionellales bacterium]|nr:hypothetical protein [Legionellales bacterium]